MRFQEAASQRLLAALCAREPADAVVAALNQLFCESFHSRS
jgi:hypothetical protein